MIRTIVNQVTFFPGSFRLTQRERPYGTQIPFDVSVEVENAKASRRWVGQQLGSSDETALSLSGHLTRAIGADNLTASRTEKDIS